MAKREKLKSHEYADLFPMMTSGELEALAEDIRVNKLQQPIVTYGGKVLDGRNRLLACERAGVDPEFVEFDGDDAGALAKVISLNVQRRDMTAAQRAIVAARATNTIGRGRPKKNGEDFPIISVSDAAKVFKVSDKSIKQARALIADAPDLALQVEACTLSLAAAYEQLQQRRKDAQRAKRDEARVAEYRDAISAGEMTVEDAIQKALEAEREEQAIQNSQADARKTHLQKLVDIVDWLERFCESKDDDGLAWTGEPNSPGMYDHGLTAERVANAGHQLHRVAVHTFNGGKNVKPKK